MPRPFRIAYGRLAQESNALSALPTTLADFRDQHLVEGDALAAACARGGDEAPGFIRNAELSGFLRAVQEAPRGEVEALPVMSAWAVPGGPLERAAFDALLGMLVEGLKARAPLDGVMLSLHGAMCVQGLRDPETAILHAVRAAVGPGVPLAVTYDLHGNLTQARVAAADFSVAYHTNPHRDHVRTGMQAGRLLLRRLRGEVAPTTAWRSLPMLLGGGTSLDFLPPMRGIFQRLKEIERDPRVLSASVLMCHPWNDDPDLGWSTVVTTDGDPALAERLAEELADRCWDVRTELPPTFPPASQAIREARSARLARSTGVVVLADASDVVTAGSTGENTRLLKALLEEARGLRSYAALRDPHAVEMLWSHAEGTEHELDLGGRLDPAQNPPLHVRGRLALKREFAGYKRVVVLDLGDLQLVITEGPALVLKPSFFRQVGLRMRHADIVVVKNFFPFRLFFLPVARRTIYVRTQGVTDVDAAFRLRFNDPVHPRDVVDHWRPADRRRRGLVPSGT